MLGSPGKEEIFCTDIAYSEQAAILLKGSFVRESRRIKDESALTVRALRHFSPQNLLNSPLIERSLGNLVHFVFSGY